MGKTLLHRFFGLGKLPGAIRAALEEEGIALLEEGIGGSVTYRNFRSRGRYSSWRRSWFTGSLVLTEKSFGAFAFSTPLIHLPVEDPRMAALDPSVAEGKKLTIRFDASDFMERASGTVECRFTTPMAGLFLERIQRA